MDQAWLDSLSEDWVSQPRSSGSQQSLLSLNSSTANSAHISTSRIPRYNSQKKSWTPTKDSNRPLHERSPSVNNITASLRAAIQRPSKLRDEITNDTRGRPLSRSVSASSILSAPYDTIQHNKSVSVSPKKGPKETPEWKRRLLHGDVAYGEQRDLFAPAGLESIFAPPPTQTTLPTKFSGPNFPERSIYMPSSPPPYSRDRGRFESSTRNKQHEAVTEEVRDQEASPLKYKLNDVASSGCSEIGISRSSSFGLNMAVPRGRGPTQDILSDASELEICGTSKKGIMNGAVRMISGQSDVRNEELSPIYVARHNTKDGGIDYAALDLPPDELQERLENLRMNSDGQILDEVEDLSQYNPGDMTTESPDLPHLGSFVNVRRGGLSHEGSFQRRLLSPSSLPAIDESIFLLGESMQASTPKELPKIKKTRPSEDYTRSREARVSYPVTKAPHPSPVKVVERTHKNSSGSPLKLFGTYDTFTNQKLLRRLSQFEEHFDGDDTAAVLPSASGQEPTGPEINQAFLAESSPKKPQRRNGKEQFKPRSFSSFGEGELDDFKFSEEISHGSDGPNPQEENKENITLPILDPRTQTRFRFQLEPSPLLETERSSERRVKYLNTTSTSKHTAILRTTRPVTASSEDNAAVPSSRGVENLHTPRKRNGDAEGKRLPKSPLKDPTPKRRRTLQRTGGEEDDLIGDDYADLDSLRDTHHHMQSVIGKKRKDARHGEDQQAANPKVLAMRQILRPRTPIPSQRSSQQYERAPLQELDLFAIEDANFQREKIAGIQAELDSTDAQKLSNVLGKSQQMQNDSRKGSVTTQDFFDEAKIIMAGIRGKARPRSGLNSVEESESDNDRNKLIEEIVLENDLEDSYQESTQEPFSRPPSREGAAVPRMPVRQQDPELLNHLRQYEEIGDMDGLIATSTKPVTMTREVVHSVKETDRILDETFSEASSRSVSQGHAVECDPPNIRITESLEMRRKRKHSGPTYSANTESHVDADFPSHGSNGSSSSQSTSNTIPTGSSRGSDSRRVIAPEAVAHLLPEHVAGMFLDRERNIWVKKKTTLEKTTAHTSSPSDETDDDPFGDIPDLSVDETQELQRIKAAAKREANAQDAKFQHAGKRHEGVSPSQMFSKSPRAGRHPPHEPASEPSRLARFTSSETVAVTNTRATSWGEDLMPPPVKKTSTQESIQDVHVARTKTTHFHEEVVEEVEREMSINEDRVQLSTPRRRRNVTISFSSPVASIIESSPYKDGNNVERELSGTDQSDNEEDGEFGNDSVFIHKRGSDQRKSSMKSHSALRNVSARLSLGGHEFTARPVSRIDEQDEDSVNENEDDHRRSSISIVVATPSVSRRISSVVVATPRPSPQFGNLSLSPMSEFTMHRADESFGIEVSYLVGGQRYVAGNGAKRTLSLSIKALVEKLAEVEPFEPFWEHLKQMELKNKQLTNLHKLDEFCARLEDLDISNNQISQLNGAPRSLRHLRITHNQVSNLTAWDHLSNLQYIDVSNNELESLSAFKPLIHLRGIRADNNKIKSLHGVNNLDGLLSLRLRGNLVESLDFTATGLQRLTDLDLRDNRVEKVKSLHELTSLKTLDLENNSISEFQIDGSEQPWGLKHLKLSGNNLEAIDVSQCPDLRLLYLDRNRLGKVNGLLHTKYLDSLSLREQQDGAVLETFFLDEAFEVRKLFLSGNLLCTFQPRTDFLNLQYLELANCGLESLPDDFGQMLCNTRVLNLNFNALRDIKPLIGIVRLKKLHLAGNRLLKLRRTASVLARLPTLALVDLRSNPLTQGFYCPITEDRIIKGGCADGEVDSAEPFTMAYANSEKDGKYAARLDMVTKMVRRVYEIMVTGVCARLKALDGLIVDRSLLSANDKVWEALLEAGLVKNTQAEHCEEQKCQTGQVVEEEVMQQTEGLPVPEKSAVWQAEDSFA